MSSRSTALSATKMAEYSLVMTSTPCRVAGCIISIRHTYLCAGALTYLFTYLHSWLWEYKTGSISETVEDRAKVTINGLYEDVMYTGFRLPPKCMTLNDLCERFKVIDSFDAAKMAKYSLVMTPTPWSCCHLASVFEIKVPYGRLHCKPEVTRCRDRSCLLLCWQGRRLRGSGRGDRPLQILWLRGRRCF